MNQIFCSASKLLAQPAFKKGDATARVAQAFSMLEGTSGRVTVSLNGDITGFTLECGGFTVQHALQGSQQNQLTLARALESAAQR